MDSDDSKKDGEGCKIGGDELTVLPVELPGGARPFIRHTADHEFQTGVMSPAKDGQPIPEGAGLFHLEHREGAHFKVTELHPAGSCEGEKSKGPAKVNSRAYRDNYDAIFGKKTVGQA